MSPHNNPDHLTIKVTDGDGRAFFVHFDRATRKLVDVYRYERIYSPRMGPPSTRTGRLIELATAKMLETQPKETTSETDV